MKEPTILYDHDCPMCQWYTAGFVAAGVLPEKGRQPFCDISPELAGKIDLNRARHEIALRDEASGQTLYGIDSMFVLFGKWQPWTRPVLRWRPFRSLMKGVYSFISYNRRILAGKKGEAGDNSCAPDFHRGWRFALIIFGFVLLTAAAVFSGNAFAGAPEKGLWLIAGWLPLILLSPFTGAGERAWNWAGHLGTLMIIQAIALFLLLPFSAIPFLIHPYALFGLGSLISLLLALPFARRRHRSEVKWGWDLIYALSHSFALAALFL